MECFLYRGRGALICKTHIGLSGQYCFVKCKYQIGGQLSYAQLQVKTVEVRSPLYTTAVADKVICVLCSACSLL